MAIPDANTTLQRLRNRYRLVVMNEDTFEEVVAFKLSRISVYILLSTLFVVLVGLTVALIAFTPLKGFIPGFSSSQLKKDATELALKSDSLSLAIKKNEVYLSSIKKVLNGKLEFEKVNKDSILAAPIEIPEIDLKASEAELELRQEVSEIEKSASKVKSKK